MATKGSTIAKQGTGETTTRAITALWRRILPAIGLELPVIGRRSREALFLDLKASPDFSSIRVERVGDCVAPVSSR
jgi:hypothetical protein